MSGKELSEAVPEATKEVSPKASKTSATPATKSTSKTAVSTKAPASKAGAKAPASASKTRVVASSISKTAVTRSGGNTPRKRTAPSPGTDDSSRNSSPALRKTPRTTTKPGGKENAAAAGGISGVKSALAGVRPLRGNRSGSESDSSPSIRKSNRLGKISKLSIKYLLDMLD